MSQEPLTGIRLIESGSGISAPFCARIFADYGADVVKIEPPGGDPSRRWGPFPGDQSDAEKSGTFFACNTNKRSVCLDLERAADRDRLRELIASADVFVENHAPAAMRAWGLDYASLSASHPGLVMISITPFGQTGPYAAWKGSDLNAFHLSAAGSRYCGRPGETPLKHGTFSADYLAAYVAATWGIAAVRGRERAGAGHHIDVSSAEALAALFVGAQNIGNVAQDGVYETRSGIGMPLGAPATILPCKDGHVWMIALEPGQWHGLRRAMGDPEWARIDMFDDMFARAQNADVIYPMLEEWTRQHTKQEVMDLCQANNCPTTALFSVAEVAGHPHLAARGFFRDIEHAALGKVRSLGAPIRLPDTACGPRRPAPLLGEHQAEVLNAISAGADAKPAGPPASGPRTPRALPLAGVRVANFGWGWLGPVVGQTLSRLGAEVYKIESRARVDINRNLPPFGGGVRDPNRSLVNHACWSGNGSITLNLKKPEACELARNFSARCDLVLENFGPGVLERLGLGYERIKQERNDIVMVSMPAAGLTGPLKGIRTYGMSLSAITGLDSVTGYLDGPPIPMENAFADPVGGVIGALAALIGLCHRDRTGRGQHVDFSQQEGVVQMVAPALMDFLFNGRVAGPMGNRHPLGVAAPHGVYPCTGDDRWIAIGVESGDEWRALVAAMGNPAWALEPAFADLARRVANQGALDERLSDWTRGRDARELAGLLQQRGIAATPVLSIPDLLTDPQFKARETFVELQHPLGFPETLYGAYVKTSGLATPIRTGPVMGQDNEHVFRELLGLSADRYARLIEDQVVF